MMTGRIHSFQSLGTVDGPGIRFVVFMQGCNLRCSCCHNPDTWNISDGKDYPVDEVIKKVMRFKEYFGKDGGITVSGGEPLLQPKFVRELFKLCHSENINTCLDTSGSILNESVDALLDETDRVLLDIKYTDNEGYIKYVGCELQKTLDFLEVLNRKNLPVTLRQVIIPTLNDNKENIIRLNEISENFSCVDKIELLPFKKICQSKYDNLKIKFPFAEIPEATQNCLKELESYLSTHRNH